MLKIFNKFMEKHDKSVDKMIDELDMMYTELLNSQKEQGLVDNILCNQVELAKELIKERNEGIKYERREQS